VDIYSVVKKAREIFIIFIYTLIIYTLNCFPSFWRISTDQCQMKSLLWWPSLTKGMQTEQLLCWSGMIGTEHSTTSSISNGEEHWFSSLIATNVRLLSTGLIAFLVVVTAHLR